MPSWLLTLRPVTLVEQFESDLRAAKSADSSTPRTYRWAADVLFQWLGHAKLTPAQVGSVEFADFARWLTTRKHDDGSAWSARGMRGALKGARAFFRWAASHGYVKPLDLGRPALPGVPKTRPASMTQEGLAVYLEAVKAYNEPLRTILLLLPLTGCRVRELCAAPIRGLGKEDGVSVMYVRRKGNPLDLVTVAKLSFEQAQVELGTNGRVSLSPLAQRILETYLVRYRRAVKGSPWLFPRAGQRDGYLGDATVRLAMRELRVRLGMPWLTPHKARHTLGALLRKNGVELDKIADALGHSNLNTTRSFYAQAPANETRDVMSRLIPTTPKGSS